MASTPGATLTKTLTALAFVALAIGLVAAVFVAFGQRPTTDVASAPPPPTAIPTTAPLAIPIPEDPVLEPTPTPSPVPLPSPTSEPTPAPTPEPTPTPDPVPTQVAEPVEAAAAPAVATETTESIEESQATVASVPLDREPAEPNPTPEPTPTATAEPTPTQEPTPTPTPEPSPSPEPTPEPTPTPEPSPTPEPTATATASPAAPIDTGDSGWQYVESTDGLFLRDEPGGDILRVLEYGSEVYLTGKLVQSEVHDWVQIESPSRGWVASTFLTPVQPEPKPTTTPPDSGEPPTAADWAALRDCESGGRYDAVSPNGLYHGAYQFAPSTWDGLAGRYRPDLVGILPSQAAPADQDAMALQLYALEGARPWPTCGRYLL